jgi:hypothetical protein
MNHKPSMTKFPQNRLGNLATAVGNRPENSKVSLAQRGKGGSVHRFSFHFFITCR